MLFNFKSVTKEILLFLLALSTVFQVIVDSPN